MNKTEFATRSATQLTVELARAKNQNPFRYKGNVQVWTNDYQRIFNSFYNSIIRTIENEKIVTDG